MRLYPTKTKGSKHYHEEFNDAHKELNNAVIDSGQALSEADPKQLGKAMFYIGNPLWNVGGSSDDITIVRDGNSLEELRDGYAVTFIPKVKNGGAATLNVQGLGVRNLKLRGADLEPSTLLPNIPVTAVYKDSAWNILAPTEVPSLKEIMSGFVPHRPYHSLSEDKPTDVSTGMFWTGYPSGKLWFDAGSYGDIPVSLDGTVPVGLHDDDYWLDASKYPYSLEKIGDDVKYFESLGDGSIHFPYSSTHPEMVKSGDFFFDEAGNIKYRSLAYGDMPVSLDGSIPESLPVGNYYLDYGVNPPLIMKKTATGAEVVESVDKCCNPLDKPEFAIKSTTTEAPVGLKVGDYWVSSAGTLMRVVGSDGTSVPVSLDGSRPKKATGDPLSDGDYWLDTAVEPPVVVKIVDGSDTIVDSIIGATTVSAGEDAIGSPITPEIASAPIGTAEHPYTTEDSAGAGDYYLSTASVLAVDGLPASVDGVPPASRLGGTPLDGGDYIDMSVYPPMVMTTDDITGEYTSSSIKFIESKKINGIRRLHIPQDDNIELVKTSSLGLQSKDGKAIPRSVYTPPINDFGTLMSITDIKNDRDKLHKINRNGVYYMDIAGYNGFGRIAPLDNNSYSSFNIKCNADIYGCYFMSKPTEDYTLKYSHLNDMTVLAVKDDYTDAKVINTKWENECYSLDSTALRNVNEWQTVDLTMFPHKEHLSRLAIGKFTMIALYENNLWGTGYNFRDGIGFYLNPDPTVNKYDKFTQITTCGKVIDVQILGNGCVAYLNSDNELRMSKIIDREVEELKWITIKDICYIIDGSFAITTKNRVLNLRTLEEVPELYVFPDGDKIYGYYGNDSIYAKWAYRQDTGGYFNLQDKVWIYEDKFNTLACDTFPFCSLTEPSFTNIEIILYDILYHAMLQIKLGKCVNQLRMIDYGGSTMMVGLINEKETNRLVSYIALPKLENPNMCKALDFDSINIYDDTKVKIVEHCDVTSIMATDLFLPEGVLKSYSSSTMDEPTSPDGSIKCCC